VGQKEEFKEGISVGGGLTHDLKKKRVNFVPRKEKTGHLGGKKRSTQEDTSQDVVGKVPKRGGIDPYYVKESFSEGNGLPKKGVKQDKGIYWKKNENRQAVIRNFRTARLGWREGESHGKGRRNTNEEDSALHWKKKR